MKILALIAAIGCVLWSEVAAQYKQRIHVQGPRVFFDRFYDEHKEQLDLWSTTSHTDGTIEAEMYTDVSTIQRFQGRVLQENQPLRFLTRAVDTHADALLEKLQITACHKLTAGYENTIGNQSEPFTASVFHDCWRTSTQIFEFLDMLTTVTPQYFTKINSIGTTFEGREIPVYKISTGVNVTKHALVGQSLIHAREWQTGSTVLYIISGLLDGLRAQDPRITSIFANYDWYFVPILNIDGYEYTWTDGNRLWRKNRRTFTKNGTAHVGVDLNRNFGPAMFFDLTGDGQYPNTEIYPGSSMLSEPESSAVFGFLRALPLPLAGLIDVHMNAQAILRPFSNQLTEAPEPYKTQLTTLGATMQMAIQDGSSVEYRNIMGGTGSYLAYGTFKDAVYMELNHTAAFTLELERMDGGFISSQATIRDVGKRTLAAFLAFSEGVEAYWRHI